MYNKTYILLSITAIKSLYNYYCIPQAYNKIYNEILWLSIIKSTSKLWMPVLKTSNRVNILSLAFMLTLLLSFTHENKPTF